MKKQNVTFGGKPLYSIMEIGKGEKIIGAWITPGIEGAGFYKLLAKRKNNGQCEWVHFIQRFNGEKDSFYRGEVENEKEIDKVISLMNNILMKTFGSECCLSLGNQEIFSLDGRKLNSDKKN